MIEAWPTDIVAGIEGIYGRSGARLDAEGGQVQHVTPANVTLIDQSPDQLNKARGKADLKGVTIVEVCWTTVYVFICSCAPRCPPWRGATHSSPLYWYVFKVDCYVYIHHMVTKKHCQTVMLFSDLIVCGSS